MEMFIAVLVFLTTDGNYVNRTFFLENPSIKVCEYILEEIQNTTIQDPSTPFIGSIYECQPVNNTYIQKFID